MNSLTKDQIAQSVAIIGMAGRFPGADSIFSFWKNLESGSCSLESLSDDEIRASGVPEDILTNPRCIKRAGVLHNIDLFDAAFFGYSPREAELIDPQQRLFLECAWEAFEDAGYMPESVKGSVGVFAGAGMNYYFAKNILSQKKRFEDIVDLVTFISNDKDYLCNRVSYKLGLTGPSFVVNSACSTSLVAVQVGYQSLLTYQCDLALCGGVSLQSPRARASLYNDGEIFSSDGYCRTFDKEAGGIVFGEGLGLVVLKRAEEAILDNDNIYAIIRSVVVNNDGAAKASFTAPGADGQSDLIALAQDMAGIHPDELAFIEAHGTGTKLGDMIEVSALTKAFRRKTERKSFCALGSVKTNVGHLDVAAGVTGLIKTALALKHRVLPATINFTEENTELALDGSPFYIAKEKITWNNSDLPLIAGVSSFGIGGTNAHAIVQEPPVRKISQKTRSYYLVKLSAKTETALSRSRTRLHKSISENKHLAIQDIAYTLQTGRRDFPYRWYTVCTDTEDLHQLLTDDSQYNSNTRFVDSQQPVVFVFPGQGAHTPGMGKKLYECEPVFATILNQAREIMLIETGDDLFSIIFPTSNIHSETAAKQLAQSTYAQPAIFTIEYALAQLYISYGISPAACIGYNIGEYTAAVIAGVFSFETAMKVVLHRSRIMASLKQVAMIYVALIQKEFMPYCKGNMVIAHSTDTHVCAEGPLDEVSACADALKQSGVQCCLLSTSCTVHDLLSKETEERRFREFIDEVSLNPLNVPFISNVYGTWITSEQCTSKDYWVRHLFERVRFSEGITELVNRKFCLYLEIGPGNMLSTFVKMRYPDSMLTVQSPLCAPVQSNEDMLFMVTLGKLWSAGVPVNWSRCHNHGDPPSRISLPAYPFERKRFWIECFREHDTQEYCHTKEKHNGSSNCEISDIVSKLNLKRNDSPPSRESLSDIVKKIWCEVLGIDDCSGDDDFLILGGNSLMLSQVTARINERLPYSLSTSSLTEFFTIDEQVDYILEHGQLRENAAPVIIQESSVQEEDELPLSPAQMRLWYLSQLHPHSPAFNITHTFRIRGPLNINQLEEALREIVERHLPLRSVFLQCNGIPVVHVQKSAQVSIVTTRYQSARRDECEAAAATLIKSESRIPFDLVKGPLFKCRLYQIDENEYLFVIHLHHLISDGWSMTNILKELQILYNAPQGQMRCALKKLNVKYSDYAAYMNHLESVPVSGDDATFWKDYLKGDLPILALPADHSRPKVLKYTAGVVTFNLPEQLSEKIKAYAGLHGVTPFSFLLSIYGLLLFRYTHQEQIIIGCPVAGRHRVDFEPLVGLFINMVPVSLEFDSCMPVEVFVNGVHVNASRAFAHQNLQFGQIVNLLQKKRQSNSNPVFQTIFAFNNYQFDIDTSGSVVFTPEVFGRGASEYDLSLYMWYSDGSFHGMFEYSDELFLEATVNALSSHFQTLLISALSDPALDLISVKILSEREQSDIALSKLKSTCEVPADKTVHEMLDRSMLMHARSIAVRDSAGVLHYDELYKRSNQICNGLRMKGVVPGTLVGLHMYRSINMLAAMIGVLKAGAAYVPLDPFFPSDRIDFMINDAALKFIIADDDNSKRFSENRSICLLVYNTSDFKEMDTQYPVYYGDGESLAYILYTSGSTGVPKGVEIQHKAMVNFLMSMKKKPGIIQMDHLLAITTISFDIAGLELFLPLIAGAVVTIVDRDVAVDGYGLRHLLENSGATVMQATPATWRLLLESGWSKGTDLKILCGGEAMSRDLADRLLATGAEVWNMYGPTETTIWSSVCKVIQGEQEPDIGEPVDNTQFHYLDNANQEVPRGVIAELCIGGLGLAKGYHNQQNLTEKKFIMINSGGRPVRVYKTGDLVRLRADNKIEYIGRADRQIKIRGYRIEPDEIEKQLEKYASVKQAVVSTYGAVSGKELVAWLRLHTGSELDITGIRQYLSDHLPHYMVPFVYIKVEQFPLTPNGKIDMNALPVPEPEKSSHTTSQMSIPEVRNAMENRILQLWEHCIGKKIHSIDDNYFDMGGHSLLAVKIMNEIFNLYAIRLPIAVLIDHATVRSFCSYLRNGNSDMTKTGDDTEQTRMQNALMYWHSMLALPPLQKQSWFSTDKSLTATITNSVAVLISRETTSKIKMYARGNKSTVFSILLAGFSGWLRCYTRKDDFTIGVSCSSQLTSAWNDSVGNIEKIVPLRLRTNLDIPFKEFCQNCHKQILGAFSHAIVGIEEISKELGFSNEKTKSLTSIRITYIKSNTECTDSFEKFQLSHHSMPGPATHVPLGLYIIDNDDTLECTMYTTSSSIDNKQIVAFSDLLVDYYSQNCSDDQIPCAAQQHNTALNEEEKFLSRLWESLLGIQEIGIDQDLFGQGGDSITVAKILFAISHEYSLQFQASVVIDCTTVRKLAAHIRRQLQEKNLSAINHVIKPVWNTVVTFKREGDIPPFFCVSGIGGNPMIYQHFSRLLKSNQPFYALQYRGIDGVLEPHTTIKAMAEEFLEDIQRVQSKGPFYIGGYSFGGLVAYEIAQLLQKKGDIVGGLVLIDSFLFKIKKWSLQKRMSSHLAKLLKRGPAYLTDRIASRLHLHKSEQKQIGNRPDFIKRFDLVAACNSQAGASYRPMPLNAEVLIIKSALNVPEDYKAQAVFLDDVNEWENLIVSEQLSKQYIQTHHYNLLHEPFVAETAQIITEWLAEQVKKRAPCDSSSVVHRVQAEM